MLAVRAVGVGSEILLLYKFNSVDERHVSCGTPLRRGIGRPVRWEMRMETVLSGMKFERIRVKKGCMLRQSILCLSPSSQTLSKARRTTFIVCLFC